MKPIHFLKTHFLLIAALVTAGITMSFNGSQRHSHSTPTVYHYNSTSMSTGAFSNTANWEVGEPTGCETARDARPCKITVPEGSTLSSVLAGKNNSQVLDIAEGYLPEP